MIIIRERLCNELLTELNTDELEKQTTQKIKESPIWILKTIFSALWYLDNVKNKSQYDYRGISL